MNRPLVIVGFALCFAVSLSLSPQALFAQHGGGHAGGGGGHAAFGGGGHASFGGGFGGHAGVGHSYSGVRAGGFAGRSSAFSRGAYNRGALNAGRFGRNHSGIGLRFRSYPYYGYNCWGGYCGNGYGGWGYPYLGGGVDPYWWWDNGDNSGYGNSYDQAAPYGYDDGLANQMQQQGVPMRPAPDSGDQDYYSRSTPPSTSQQQSERTQAAPTTVLVFRDQHQEQVQNYAIVGQTLWNFTAQRTEKIPLSDLDLPATQKANEDHGVAFRLPSSSEGQ